MNQKDNRTSVRKLAFAAMFAAMTLLATSVLKIQTPAFGYIHVGDCFVLLAGILLGPFTGGLSAGIGSALADILGGYAIWAPGTFVIKFMTAATAAWVYRVIAAPGLRKWRTLPTVVASGIVGEAVMAAGYFLLNVLLFVLMNGAFSAAGIAAGVSVSLTDVVTSYRSLSETIEAYPLIVWL